MNLILLSRSMFDKMVDRLDLGVAIDDRFAYAIDGTNVFAAILPTEVTA